MVRSNELSKMQSYIRNFVAQKPAQAEKGRRIADNFFCLRNCAIPIWLLAGRDRAREFQTELWQVLHQQWSAFHNLARKRPVVEQHRAAEHAAVWHRTQNFFCSAAHDLPVIDNDYEFETKRFVRLCSCDVFKTFSFVPIFLT